MSNLERQSKSSLRSRTFSSLSVRQSGTIQKSSSSQGGRLQKPTQKALSKPLLHILDKDERPGDMVSKPKAVALRGQMDVYIARAEIELRNAMQEKYEKPGDRYRIQHRNHDARLLFQQLAHLDLLPWSDRNVDYIHPDNLKNDLMFPLGHPILGRTYRRHPFKARFNEYYPVTDYFSLLFNEREQALLSLLGQLGATKITMTPIPATSTLNCQENLAAQLHQKVYKYPKQLDTSLQSIDFSRHPWLAGEPAWQEVVHERLERGALAAQFEFDCDVMGMLKSQIKMIGQLVPGLDSMRLPDNYKDAVANQILQPRQVKVEFCEIER